MSSPARPAKLKSVGNGKRTPVRPAGCLHRACPDVAAAGDVSAQLAVLLERVEALSDLPAQVAALDRHVGVLADTIEGVKDGVNLLVAAHELSVRQRSTGGEGHAA